MEAQKFDLLLRNVRPIFPLGKLREQMDIGIRDGSIAYLGAHSEESCAAQTLDFHGKIISPGFVETHAYIQCAFANGEACTRGHRATADAINETAAYLRRSTSQEQQQRMERALQRYAENGTTTLRTALFPCEIETGLAAFHAAKTRWAERMELLVTVPYEPQYAEAWEKAAAAGRIDAVGCWPDILWDENGLARHGFDGKKLREAMVLAEKYNLPLDIDCTAVPGSGDISSFALAAQKALPPDAFYAKPSAPDVPLFYGRINCCHCDTLSDRSAQGDLSKQAIYACAKTYVNFTAMTTDAMLLAEENRRSLAPIRAFLDAGVNVSVSCGHFRDYFHPFGNGAMLAELLTTAQAQQVGTRGDLEKFFEFITYNPAKTLQLKQYGLLPDCRADFVIFDADSVQNLILSQSACRAVFKSGKPVLNHMQGGETNGEI